MSTKKRTLLHALFGLAVATLLLGAAAAQSATMQTNATADGNRASMEASYDKEPRGDRASANECTNDRPTGTTHCPRPPPKPEPRPQPCRPETQAGNSSARPCPEPQPGWHFQADPTHVKLQPGETKTVALVAKARHDMSARLIILQLPPGIRAELGQEYVKVPAGGASHVKLALSAYADPAAGGDAPREAIVRIEATAQETGEKRIADIHVQRGGDKPREPDRPSFYLKANPEVQRLGDQGKAVFEVYAAARHATVLDLHVLTEARGYAWELGESTLRVPANGFAHTTFTVRRADATIANDPPCDDAASCGALFGILGTSRESGEMHGVRVKVVTQPPGAGVRMALHPAHVDVGPDGGKVALLLQGGHREAGLRLHAKILDERDGPSTAVVSWRIELERDGVKLGPGDREWVFVTLKPLGNDARPIKYAIVGELHDGGQIVAVGTARVAAASMA